MNLGQAVALDCWAEARPAPAFARSEEGPPARVVTHYALQGADFDPGRPKPPGGQPGPRSLGVYNKLLSVLGGSKLNWDGIQAAMNEKRGSMNGALVRARKRGLVLVEGRCGHYLYKLSAAGVAELEQIRALEMESAPTYPAGQPQTESPA